MTILRLFAYADYDVRAITVNDEPWWITADVLKVLDLSRSSVALLDDDEKGVHTVDTPGGPQEMSFISESGLYSLILRSRKPEAKEFKRWIVREVLPQIRRTGAYVPEFQIPQTLAEALELAARQARELEVARPKLEAFDTFLNGAGAYKIGTVAKMIGVGPNKLFDFLRAERILISSKPRRNEPFSLERTRAWFDVNTYPTDKTNGHAATTTYVTPYGAEQIRLLAIRRGLIEPQLLALTGGA